MRRTASDPDQNFCDVFGDERLGSFIRLFRLNSIAFVTNEREFSFRQAVRATRVVDKHVQLPALYGLAGPVSKGVDALGFTYVKGMEFGFGRSCLARFSGNFFEAFDAARANQNF